MRQRPKGSRTLAGYVLTQRGIRLHPGSIIVRPVTETGSSRSVLRGPLTREGEFKFDLEGPDWQGHWCQCIVRDGKGEPGDGTVGELHRGLHPISEDLVITVYDRTYEGWRLEGEIRFPPSVTSISGFVVLHTAIEGVPRFGFADARFNGNPSPVSIQLHALRAEHITGPVQLEIMDPQYQNVTEVSFTSLTELRDRLKAGLLIPLQSIRLSVPDLRPQVPAARVQLRPARLGLGGQHGWVTVEQRKCDALIGSGEWKVLGEDTNGGNQTVGTVRIAPGETKGQVEWHSPLQGTFEQEIEVVDSQEKPVPGARVLYTRLDEDPLKSALIMGLSETTSPLGKVVIGKLLEGNYATKVSAPGLPPDGVDGVRFTVPSGPVRFVVPRQRGIIVRIMADDSHDSLPVLRAFYRRSASSPEPWQARKLPGLGGDMVLHGLSEGTYEVVLVADQHVGESRAALTVASEDVVAAYVRLDVAAVVEGVVVSKDGQALGGRVVTAETEARYASPEARPWLSTRTDQNGGFRIVAKEGDVTSLAVLAADGPGVVVRVPATSAERIVCP